MTYYMVLELDSISFSYEKNNILNGLDLVVNTGDFVIIKGPSGIGKTTLLNIIGLIEDVDQGIIRIEDTEITNDNRNNYKKSFSYLFQNPVLINHLTVNENIYLYGKWWGQNDEFILEQREELIERVGLSHLSHQLPIYLSNGERQRIALLSCLICSPKILLLDEPLGSVDSKNKNKFIEELDNLVVGKITTICVTHSNSFDELSNKIYFLEKGKLMSDKS